MQKFFCSIGTRSN